MLLASSRGERAPWIALNLGCTSQTVRDAIHDFNQRGMDALEANSSRPKRTPEAFEPRERRGTQGNAPPFCEGIRIPHEPVDFGYALRGTL
jgi:hypothetical protein